MLGGKGLPLELTHMNMRKLWRTSNRDKIKDHNASQNNPATVQTMNFNRPSTVHSVGSKLPAHGMSRAPQQQQQQQQQHIPMEFVSSDEDEELSRLADVINHPTQRAVLQVNHHQNPSHQSSSGLEVRNGASKGSPSKNSGINAQDHSLRAMAELQQRSVARPSTSQRSLYNLSYGKTGNSSASGKILTSSASVPLFDERSIKTSHAIHRLRPTSADSDNGLLLPQSATNVSRTRSYMNNYDWATLKNDEHTVSTENTLLHRQTTTLKARLHRVERECWTQLGKNDTLKDALGRLKKEHGVSVGKNKKFERDLAMLHAKTSKEIVMLKAQLKEISDRVKRAEKDSEMHRSARDEAEAKLRANEEMLRNHPTTRLTGQVEELDKAVVALKQELDATRSHNKALEAQLQRAAHDMTTLRSKLEEQSALTASVKSRGGSMEINVAAPHDGSMLINHLTNSPKVSQGQYPEEASPKKKNHSRRSSRARKSPSSKGSPARGRSPKPDDEYDNHRKSSRSSSRRSSITNSEHRRTGSGQNVANLGGMFSPSGGHRLEVRVRQRRLSLKEEMDQAKLQGAQALEADAFAAMVQRNDHKRMQAQVVELQAELKQLKSELKACSETNRILAERDEEQTRAIERFEERAEQHEIAKDRLLFNLSVAKGEKKEKVAMHEDMKRKLSDVEGVLSKEREDAKVVREQHNVVEKVLGLWLQLEIQRRKRKQRAKNLVKQMQCDIGLVADETSKKHPDYPVSVGRLSTTSPAWRAGVRKNDVITSFGGKAVKTKEECKRVLTDTKPGKTVVIELLRKKSGSRGFSMFGSNPEDLQKHRCEVYVAAKGYPEDAVNFLLKLAYEPSDNNMEIWLRDLRRLKAGWLESVVTSAEMGLTEMKNESNRLQANSVKSSVNSMLNSKSKIQSAPKEPAAVATSDPKRENV